MSYRPVEIYAPLVGVTHNVSLLSLNKYLLSTFLVSGVLVPRALPVTDKGTNTIELISAP